MSAGATLAIVVVVMTLLGQQWLNRNAGKLLQAVRKNRIHGESPQQAIARAYSMEKASQRLFWLGALLALLSFILLR